jgi:AraC-like DNA-binding protein
MVLLPDPARARVARAISASRTERLGPPCSSLESTWELDATEPGDFHYVPSDPCTDVVVAIDHHGQAHSLVAPPAGAFAVVRRTPGFSYVGARIRPGFGGVLLSSPTETLARLDLGFVDSLEDARRKLADAIRELTEAPRSAPPPWVAEVTRVAGEFAWHRGNAAAVARHAGVSARTFQRGLLTWVGLPPKALLRVERARAAARQLAQGARAVETAFVLGFADQAHLTRELRQIFGYSPREMQALPAVAELFKTFRPATSTIGR